MWFPRLRVGDRNGTPGIDRAEGADTLVVNKTKPENKSPIFS